MALSADGVIGLTSMRLFPDGIRSAILDSAASPQEQWALDPYRGEQEMLEKVFAGCAANAACNARYPKIRKLFLDLVHKLNKHPAIVPSPDFLPHGVVFRVNGTEVYRQALLSVSAGYGPGGRGDGDGIRPLLETIWRMTHGELDDVIAGDCCGPIVTDEDAFRAEGKTMSYVCHDMVDFLTPDDLRRAAQDVPELSALFLDPNFEFSSGDPVSPAGCRLWNVGVAEPAQHQPVHSAIPTLVLAGEYDTGVPALVVRQIPPTLSNSYYYEFPASPHIQLASFSPVADCSRAIAAQFLDRPTARPDSSCIASLPPFDFTP